jgi:2-(1,2-epoxy-1,2-dihydrophenyl)acetyl-CoA isomerase
MKRKIKQDSNEELFVGRQIDSSAFLYLKENLLLRATDLDRKDHLLEYMDRISQDVSVNALVIAGSFEKTGAKEYYEFYHRLCRLKFDRNAIYRMYNAVDQFILKIVEFQKPVIHVDSGQLIPLYLNISLACDYRIISENAVFQNAYIDLGLLPKGGGVFFLSKILGKSRALELLMSEDEIPAKQALSLGIVDQVVLPGQLEDAALSAALRFDKIPGRTFSGIKRLLSFSQKELADYLDRENTELMRIIDSTEFRQDLGKCPD